MARSAAFGSGDVSLQFSGGDLLCVGQQQARSFLFGGTGSNGSKGFEFAAGGSGAASETARVPEFDGSFVLFRTRVVGTNFSVRSVVDWRCGGGASVPPGASAAGWTGSVQRIFVAPFASEGGGAGTRALCARAARWGSPIADRHGNAS